MRLLEAPSSVLSTVAILLAASTTPVSAGPLSAIADLVRHHFEERLPEDVYLQNATIEARGGSSSSGTCSAGQTTCGYYGQICCNSATETCGTNAKNEAICVAAAGVTAAASGTGQWAYYTSTWVETNLVTKTSVYSSWVAATTAAAPGGTCTPVWSNNESPCGPICCSSGQYCADATNGLCKPAGNGGFTTTGVGYSAPLRPTTSGGVIITATISPTTTVPFQTPVGTGAQTATPVASGGGGLSGGAIAGIVIGVIVGVALLILFCLLCCLKAGIDGVLALFGIGGKKRRGRRVVEEEYIETHHRRGSRADDRRWYGSAAGSRPTRPPPSERRKTGGIGGLGAMGAGLAGLAVALGLKRRHDRKHDEKSEYSSSYDSYYDYSASSE
jgi:hypothetical protein